ncbi:hypothetical protein [uncultured Paracoccus sp.]|uniref:hypothetical protein n=1 Tax=uncultured Paracoccus sp. TaxID=189685 RepID=UPI002601EEA8|nr:hypothetical protein [uncultured Paracoccus sp.]
MTRSLFLICLMAAVMFLAVLPHATMAGGSYDAASKCQHDVSGVIEQQNEDRYCGGADHMVTAACAIACVGPFAPGSQPFGTMPVEFSAAALRFPTTLVLRGRLTDPDDRPPKSI